jgi:hypothetical protein
MKKNYLVYNLLRLSKHWPVYTFLVYMYYLFIPTKVHVCTLSSTELLACTSINALMQQANI